MTLWSEENFENICKNVGSILQYSPVLDNNLCYQAPRFLIQTNMVDKIRKKINTHAEGKEWRINLVEISSVAKNEMGEGEETMLSYNQHNGSVFFNQRNNSKSDEEDQNDRDSVDSEFFNSQMQRTDDRIIEEGWNEGEDCRGEDGMVDNTMAERENKVDEFLDLVTDNEEDTGEGITDSQLNPLTPLDLNQKMSEETLGRNRDNWVIRENTDSEGSELVLQDNGSIEVLEDMVGDDLASKGSSQPSLLKVLNSLQIKSNRGRPKKNHINKENRAFRISKRKRKSGGVGLKMIEDNVQHAKRDEAKAILDTGLEMGLIAVESEEASLQIIRVRLQLR